MFLTDAIFNGADLLFYLGALAAVRIWYKAAKRKHDAELEQQED